MGKIFSDAVKIAMPKECRKQDIKLFLDKLGLLDIMLYIENGGGYMDSGYRIGIREQKIRVKVLEIASSLDGGGVDRLKDGRTGEIYG